MNTSDTWQEAADHSPLGEKRWPGWEELSQEQNLLYRLIDNMPDFIFVKDSHSRFIITNRSHLRILGASSRSEVVGRTDFDFFPHELAERYFRDEQWVIQSGTPIVDREEPVTDADGSQRLVATTKVPIYDEHNRVVGIMGISRDITTRKQTEREKAMLEERLRQAEKLESIGQLAGGVAHDFNNMLGAISGYADLIKRKFGSNNKTLCDYVDIIIDACKRAADLTGKLLAFARKGKYEMKPIDLHATIDDAIRLLEHTIDKRIVIRTSFHANPSTVMGDRTQLQNAILNLAVNARDAMPNGGYLTFETEVVSLDTHYLEKHLHKMPPGRYIKVSVSDTGVGMDEQTISKLFEPFFTTKGPGKGTGLGLASVYGTVRGHNGGIEVSSKKGKGSTFILFFPLCETPLPQGHLSADSVPLRKGKARILVVDDEEIVRKMASQVLEELGYTVATCTNGKEAVRFLAAHPGDIDLAIVDMIMPQMGGYDCVHRLKEICPDLKVIITTGYSIASDTQRIITKGIAAFIQKPFDIEELAATVADVLKGST